MTVNDAIHSHLSAEQIQAFLDGELPRKELTAAEEHLVGCPRCSAEVEAWQAIFEDLGELFRHRPHEGFVDRVMSNVTVPEARPFAARLRDHVASALSAHDDSHVPGEVLQDFLEGSLAARRAQRIEGHLARCATCTTEADAWLAVMRRLDGLDAFAPAEGFAERVLSEVEIPEQVPLAARIRARIDSLFGSEVPEHVPAGILQDFIDGVLPTTAVARLEAHVDECGRCARELDSWQTVAARLGALERLEPTDGFADQVMVRLRKARATAVVAEPASAWTRGLVAARQAVAGAGRAAGRLVPETRQAVAALSGAAVTPMVVIGLVVSALWSHPTLTVGSLVSFAWWQVTDLAGVALAGVSGVATQSAEVFGVFSLLETLAAAPAMVAGGVLLYTMMCALALRVLYKNLFANRPSGGHHPHVSTAS